MVKLLQTYLEYGNRFCGIEHTVKKGQDLVYATVLKKSKNDVDIENTFEDTSIEKLISKLPKRQHVFLIINNDHVLTKRLESNQSETLKLVHTAFPNINLDDFYYEVITQQQNDFVSICRKKNIEELIAKYSENGFSVINISLGNTITSSIINYIGSTNILTSNASIAIRDDAIDSIERTETEALVNYDINGLTVSNNQLLSATGALNSVLHNFHPVTNFDLLKASLKSEFKQTRFFTLFLKFGLIFILTLLMINFFMFNHYFNAVNTLQQTSQINQNTKQVTLKLAEDVSKSQKMVDDMLKSSSSRSSFYVNSIIQGLPSSILLSELNYQPVLKRIKNDQAIEINNDVILISGESNHSEQFSKWIMVLENIKWINKAEVLNYEDKTNTISNFSIKLSISNDKQS